MRQLAQNSVQSDNHQGRMQESRGGYTWAGKSAGQVQNSGQSLKQSRLDENNHGASQSQDTNALLDELDNNPKPPKKEPSDKTDAQITKYINENEILKKKNVVFSKEGKDRPRAQGAGRTGVSAREVAQRQTHTACPDRRAVCDPGV